MARIKLTAAIPAGLVGLFVLLWYIQPYPWLGIAVGLVAGLMTYAILNSGRIDRFRKPLFVAITLVTGLSLLGLFFYWGPTQFIQWVERFDAGYYFPGSGGAGTISYPSPLLLPAIFWRGAEFLAQFDMWQTSVPGSFIVFLLFMVPYILIFLVFGKAFCGWICPLGGLPDLMSSGSRTRWQLKFLKQGMEVDGGTTYTGLKGWVKAIKFVLLGLLLVLSVVLGFAIVHLFYPVFWMQSWPVFWIVIAVLFVTAILLPILTRQRWWCFVCPVGAIFTPLKRINPFRIKIEKDKCVKCMDCVNACQVFAMTPQTVESGHTDRNECTFCGRCIEACSEEAVDIFWMNGYRKVRTVFIAGVIATVFALYIWYMIIMVSLVSNLGSFRWF